MSRIGYSFWRRLLRRAIAPAWGVAIGFVSLLVYWPGIVGVLPGLSEYFDFKPLEAIDLRLGDALHRNFVRRQAKKDLPPICVVGITAEGLARYGPMPWPRSVHARLVDRLREMGASVIAFDIFFPKAGQRESELRADADFARAIRQAGNVILPRCGLMPDPVPHAQPYAEQPENPVLGRTAERPTRSPDGTFRTSLREAADSIYRHAADIGHINIFYDDDLVARRVPVAIADLGDEHCYLPLGVVAALFRRTESSRIKIEPHALWYGDVRIPLDERGCLVINFQPFSLIIDTRPAEMRAVEAGLPWKARSERSLPIQFYSYTDVIDGTAPAAAFKDAIVLIGQCVWGTREDLHLTPEGNQYGVLVQAVLLHTVLTRQFLEPVGPWATALSVLAVSFLLGTLCFNLRMRGSSYVVVIGGVLLMALGVAVTLLVAGMLRRNGLMLDVTPFFLAIGLNLIGGIASNAARTTREAERRNREMDLLMVAGQKHMSDLVDGEAPRGTAIPGSAQTAISSSLSLRSPEIVAETFWESIPCEGVVLFLVGQCATLTFERKVVRGFGRGLTENQIEAIGVRLCWEAFKRGRPILYSRRDAEWPFPQAPAALQTLLCIPVSARGNPLAVVLLFNKRPTFASPEKEFTEEDLRLVAALRYQAAALLENAWRCQLEYAMFDGFARSLAKAVDFRDRYTRGHSERVAALSRAIAEELGLTKDEVEIVQRAATLHDLGKIGVDDAVLKKPGRLTDEEFALIRAHPANGYEILRAAPSFEPMLPGIRHHHERYDGRGYPDGIHGNNIPLLARIIAAADAYDAMTSDRTYRRALPESKAREELLAGAGTQFDPQVVQALLRALDKKVICKRTYEMGNAATAPPVPIDNAETQVAPPSTCRTP